MVTTAREGRGAARRRSGRVGRVGPPALPMLWTGRTMGSTSEGSGGTAAAPVVRRLSLRLSGAVQGVGMRPFLARLARDLGLAGHVFNDADGVGVVIEGLETATFVERLGAEAPPLARIERLTVVEEAPQGTIGFAIRPSAGGRVTTRIVPDAATCPDCLADIRDPASRYFGYPFTNCTHCGPRYTITRALPYDRGQTAMAAFPMCDDCRAEYEDPESRRFHAEPVACPACGPRLTHPVGAIAAALAGGRIVALKGIGGFHLMCDAGDAAAVAELRRRKGREAKPFAVMVADLDAAGRIGRIGAAERAALTAPAHPIVLLARHPDAPLAALVAPGLDEVGVMLAYAPLHHLLFDALTAAGGPTVLVATSANPGGEPLVIDDDDARRRLAGIADVVVGHDRAIVIRADDSVVRTIAGAPTFLRRARGFVPEPIELAADGPCVAAFGAHLKATVTVTRGREAFVSQHVGDLETVETVRFFAETLRHLTAILDVRPEIVASDLAADYRSTRLAEETGLPHVRLQHHAAHVAAVAAEYRLDGPDGGPVLGVALDGHGIGSDGGNWGGELIEVTGGDWRRLGSLAPLALPGGDRAAREPWRMAAAALAALGRGDAIAARFADERFARPIADGLAKPGFFPVTTSMGRLFDAAAGLLRTCRVQRYEGQAAMELEALAAGRATVLAGGWRLADGVLDFAPLLAALADCGDAAEGAALFHGTVAAGVAAWIAAAAHASGAERAALSGGCFHNRVLTENLLDGLSALGIEGLIPRRVPAGDGGLSLGQAAMARIIGA
jgi:hydrogenase maturation protein HypF